MISARQRWKTPLKIRSVLHRSRDLRTRRRREHPLAYKPNYHGLIQSLVLRTIQVLMHGVHRYKMCGG